jgi:hypothetical protein
MNSEVSAAPDARHPPPARLASLADIRLDDRSLIGIAGG